MERNMEFNNYSQSFENNYDSSGFDNMFNPVVQYEQAYMYYKYLTQQLDYKIKSKEYERLCRNTTSRKD